MSLRVTASFHIGFSPEELERVGPKNLGEGSTRQLVIWLHYRELLEILKLFELKIIGFWCEPREPITMIHDFITPGQWVKSFR